MQLLRVTGKNKHTRHTMDATTQSLFITFFILQIIFTSQLSQIADLSGGSKSKEWNGSILKADVQVSVRHTNCSYGKNVPSQVLGTVEPLYAISRLHCVLICPNSIVYPASNACYIFGSQLLSDSLTDDPAFDVCIMNPQDVRCLASPCYLMSGQSECSSTVPGPTCTCPDGYDPAFCYDADFHTQK